MQVVSDFNLKHYNTFGIDAKCSLFIEFDSVEELPAVLGLIRERTGRLLILGGGSNLLLTSDFDGVVVHPAIKGYDSNVVDDNVFVRAGCGMIWDELVEICVAQGWHGIENLSLIPGTVGASAVQNIGAYGVEAKDVIDFVEVVDIFTGEQLRLSCSECDYGYRHSRFKSEWCNRFIITHVTYKLSKTFTPKTDYGNIQKELQERGIPGEPTPSELREVIIAIRRAKLPDPEVEGNAGSFFMNPVVDTEKYKELLCHYPNMPHYTIDAGHEKIPAGWLIEQCGWKGRTLGRAGVHDKQALVLVNKGGATGAEVLRLCDAVRKDVYERFGIEIVPEANIL